jgi:RsiW-degrading membrane proteinase PrsW (M82 family)
MKLVLNIRSGSLAGKNFELTEGFLTVGRDENCSVRFDPRSERIASKQHAFIEAKPDGFYVTDNQSSNGTLLNGEKIQSAKLNSGDRLQFGKNGVEASVNLETNSYTSEATHIKPKFGLPVNTSSQPVNQVPPNATQSWRNSIAGLSAAHIETPVETNQTNKYIGIGIAIFTIVFLSLIVSLIMFTSVGVVAAVIASVIAFVPACFYILPLIWLDRYDPEPLWLLALAFAWGALVAVIVSFIVNTLIGTVVGISVSPQAGELVGAVISAPIFEEGSKGLGLVLLLVFFRRYFDDILDGIIFAGVIALGFATVENVLYYGGGLAKGGSSQLLVLFVLRGIMSPFAHVSFTAMTGIGCGLARESHNKIFRIIMPIIGYGCAVFLHALWNGMATVAGLGGFILGYVVLEVPFFLIFVGFAFYTMHRQNKILKEMLAIDVARGLIPKEHLEIATSAFRSSGWLLGSIFNGKFKARNRYLRAVGKLGLTYWHIQRATAAQGQTGSFQQNPILRAEVEKWREQV